MREKKEKLYDGGKDRIKKIGGKMKKILEILKWLFIAPFLFFGVWLIALFSEKFRTSLIDTIERLLNKAVTEYERSL